MIIRAFRTALSRMASDLASKRYDVGTLATALSCELCKGLFRSTLADIKATLEGDNTYNALKKLAPDKCKALRDDRFTENPLCLWAQGTDATARKILSSGVLKEVVIYHDPSARTLMSALLRNTTPQAGGYKTSDLTGDQGENVIEALVALYKLDEDFSSVVDIGGQDATFVRKFPTAIQRIIMDINTLSPFLNKTEGVKFAIGDARIILKKPSDVFDKLRPRTVFAMSNFINVLSPLDAKKILEMVIHKMKPGDILAISSLATEHFAKRDRFKGREDPELGIVEFFISRIAPDTKYKSTTSKKFTLLMLKKFEELKFRMEKLESRLCVVEKGDENRLIPVHFRTVVFERK